MIAPLSSQYRTRTQHPLAAYRVSVERPGRLDVNDRLKWNVDPIGGRLIHTDWSQLPSARINLAERGNKIHHRRGNRSGHRIHVGFLHNGLLVLRHAVLRLFRIVGFSDTRERSAGKRIRRGPALRGGSVRVYGEESGLVLRRGKPDHQRDHQSDTNADADANSRAYSERDCGA